MIDNEQDEFSGDVWQTQKPEEPALEEDGPVIWKDPDDDMTQIPNDEEEPVTPSMNTITSEEQSDDAYEENPDENVLDDLYGNPNTVAEQKEETEEQSEEEADEKNLPPPIERHKNKALVLDRQKIILVIAGIFVSILIISTVIIPLFKTEKKESKKMEKANSAYAPSEFLTWSEPEQVAPPMEDSNSAMATKNDEKQSFEERFPEPTTTTNTAPVQIPQSQPQTVSVSDFPKTNRNEQQKALAHVSLSDTGGFSLSSLTDSQSNTMGYTGVGYGNTQASNAYTPAALANNMNSFLAAQQSSYITQNNQANKENFFNDDSRQSGTYQWNTEFSLWKGTIIPAVLETAINTDLPGVVIATVTTNIYSSLDGKYILIPQGSKLYAIYNSSVSYGQNRVQVAWNTLIRPDGLEINLGNLNGVDAQGQSGYAGFTNTHPFEYAKALGLIAMFSIFDTKMDNVIASQGNAYAQNALSDTYQQIQKMNSQILERALDIQPTVKISAGTEVNLITNVTMDLPPAASVPATPYPTR